MSYVCRRLELIIYADHIMLIYITLCHCVYIFPMCHIYSYYVQYLFNFKCSQLFVQFYMYLISVIFPCILAFLWPRMCNKYMNEMNEIMNLSVNY